MTDTRYEADLLFKVRQLLFAALEDDGVEITGSGFGMGQADIEIEALQRVAREMKHDC